MESRDEVRTPWRPLGLLAATVLLAGGCGKSGSPSSPWIPEPPPTYAPEFTAWPIDSADLSNIVALGNLNPPGHTLPSDHIYFYLVDRNHAANDPSHRPLVYAPCNGRVVEVRRGSDDRLRLQVNANVSYYLSHIHIDSTITLGQEIVAGQRVGTASEFSYAVDLGAFDSTSTLPFANPARYPAETIHARMALQYFTEPLRSILYARVRRDPPDLDGRICFDVPGTAAGNWFLVGLPASQSADVTAWTKQLALVRDFVHPDRQAFSCGGTLPYVGASITGAGDPDYATVTPASGEVTYSLHPMFGTGGDPAWGSVRMQMISPDTLKVELFPGAATAPPFANAAHLYVR